MPNDESTPPLGSDEFFHFEYLHFDPDNAETGFSNMAEVSYDRRMAGDKASRLVADPKVWAIHIRRFEQPEQGVHLYDEAYRLPVAQNAAYRERKRAETLQKLLGAAVESNHKLESAFDAAVDSYEVGKAADDAVIAELVRMLESIREMAVRDQRDAVFTEPADIARMTKVSLQALRDSERRKAKERLKRQRETQGTTEGENGPQEAAQARLCTKCGKDDEAHIMWAQRHLPEFPEDLDPRIVEARKGMFPGDEEQRRVQVELDAMRERVEGTTDTPEAERSPDDVCVCGHTRRQHRPGTPDKYCLGCDNGYTHKFKLAVL